MILQDDIKALVGNHVAPYIYNSNHFEPGKTPIYYSGPYWDNKETEAAMDSFLNGRWVTTGESVFKFERQRCGLGGGVLARGGGGAGG
jgi:CDP-6-deoxy-D-xylo-4-hexulose-3-dehydrase